MQTREAVDLTGDGRGANPVLDLKAGDWVAVRSPGEILATLDENACLEELPFMPQMLQYCGRTFRVRKRAHKLCDTVHGTGARRMTDAVFLDGLQCDGEAFGGCEMACSIVWKEAWLRRVDEGTAASPSTRDDRLHALAWQASRRSSPGQDDADTVYVCQATRLPAATGPLPWWSLSQYVVDYRSGNAPLSAILGRLFFLFYSQLASAGVGLGTALRWLYNAVQTANGRWTYPVRMGRVPARTPTPTADLGLQVGDLVRVKSFEQILDTVDKRLVNRGLGFHPEMVVYCGKTFRVQQRLRKLINEKTGRIMTLKNSCLVLEGAGCCGRYTRPLNCPRGLPPYWREVWLERVETGAASSSAGEHARKPVTG